MSKRHQFPPIDPTLVVPHAKFLKNSAAYRGKGVHDIVDELEDVTNSDGPAVRVHYHNDQTGRHASMLMVEFCQGIEHQLVPPEDPIPVPELPPSELESGSESGPITMDMVFAELRAIRVHQEDILSYLRRIPPQQLSFPHA